MRYMWWKRECLNVCVFPAGGGVSNFARRGGSEVCVVISGQHQGQVYLCDTANLGSSAHSRHHISKGGPGRTLILLSGLVSKATLHVWCESHQPFTEQKTLLHTVHAKQTQGLKRAARSAYCSSLWLILSYRKKNQNKTYYLNKKLLKCIFLQAWHDGQNGQTSDNLTSSEHHRQIQTLYDLFSASWVSTTLWHSSPISFLQIHT